MKEPYWWYVLHVRSNKEHRVVENFQQAYEQTGLSYELRAFCPESERFYKTKQSQISQRKYIKRPLFSGYVFVETNMPSKEFRTVFNDLLYNSNDIIRLLRYGNSDEIALKKEERQRFEFLLKGKRAIEHSVGYIEGDKIIITGGGLMGMEGCIRKINRHNRTADIEIDMFNKKQTIKVALEIVSKTLNTAELS